ncbi:hypothetical protein GCM10023259_041030 [Thermocatellispora tengchongensis]
MAASVVIPASAAHADLDATGQWGSVLPWPVMPINSALTADGKVMTFGTDTAGNQGGEWNFDIWDPATGTHELTDNTTFTDLFCSVQVYDPIRDVIFTAGGDDGRSPGSNWGPVGFTSFSAADGLRNEAPMNFPRWYPTATVMPNGEIVVEGGSSEGVGGPGVLTPERYTPGVGWTSLTAASSAYAYGNDQNRWWYPRSWVAPNGKIFGVSGSNMYYLDPAGAGSITPAGTFPGGNIGATSTAVMYRPGKILQVGGGGYSNGGGGDGSKAASVIDINGATPAVTPAAPMTFGRHWADATVLPTGDVLVNGGSLPNNGDTGVAYQPELWNPDTNTWTTLPAEERMRLYHSTSILLPDGRVLVGGGGAPGPQSNLNAQIYSPPYLFDGNSPAPRPAITSAPDTITHGTPFSIEVSGSVSRATLVRAGAVTHSFNGGQRFMDLPISGSGSSRTLTAPANGNIAPPGLYLLFVLDSEGTPSVAKLVQIDPPGNRPAVLADGFEDGAVAAPGGWIDYSAGQSLGPWSVTAPITKDQAGHHGGLGETGHHLDLDDDGQVRRTITGLTPGATYQLSLRYARHRGTDGPVSATVSIAGLNHTWSASNTSSGTFSTLDQTFTATATSHTLTLTGAGSTSGCCGMVIDDVAIWRTGTVPVTPTLVDSFEEGPPAPVKGWIDYSAGQSFGPWSVTAPVSRDQAGSHFGLGFVGHHLDLDDDGQVTRTVTGLTPGRPHTITLRYARHFALGGSVSANVSIAGLDHTWSASNTSAAEFGVLKQTFTPTETSHTLTLRGVSSASGCCGMVVDNVVIWQNAPGGGGPLTAPARRAGPEDHSKHH